MKTLNEFISEADDKKLQAVPLDKVSKNLSSLLKNNGVKLSKVSGKYQPVFGSAELQFKIENASIDGTKISNFTFIVQSGGDVVVNASGAGRKHLVTLTRVGNIKDLSKLEDSKGIFADIVKFTIEEIRDTIRLDKMMK
jgi:hypothetical protein